mgnify:CR=1 FL=1
MEVLIKDSHAGISYIVLISGYTEREYYINKYCDHNNIRMDDIIQTSMVYSLIMLKMVFIVSIK